MKRSQTSSARAFFDGRLVLVGIRRDRYPALWFLCEFLDELTAELDSQTEADTELKNTIVAARAAALSNKDAEFVRLGYRIGRLLGFWHVDVSDGYHKRVLRQKLPMATLLSARGRARRKLSREKEELQTLAAAWNELTKKDSEKRPTQSDLCAATKIKESRIRKLTTTKIVKVAGLLRKNASKS